MKAPPNPQLDALLDTVIKAADLDALIDAVLWQESQPDWWPRPQVGVLAPVDTAPF